MKKYNNLKKLVIVLNVVAAAAIFASTTSFLLFPQKISPPALNAAGTENNGNGSINLNQPVSRAVDTSTITSFKPPAPPKPAEDKTTNETALDLAPYIQVIGTSKNSNPENSTAIIALKRKNSEQKLVFYKQQLEDIGITGVVVSDIQEAYVEFTVANKKQQLFITADNTVIIPPNTPGSGKQPVPPGIRRPPELPVSNPNNPGGPSPGANTGPAVPASGPSGAELDKFNTTQNPNDPYSYDLDPNEAELLGTSEMQQRISQEVDARPYLLGDDGNSCKGFTLNKIAPGSVLEKRGFQKGDIVKSVNGTPIDSVATGKRLMKDPSIRASGSVTVEVERAGKSITLKYNVKK